MTERTKTLGDIRLALRTMGSDLARLNHLVASAVDLREGDVTILDHVGRVGPISPGALADELRIHPATMTGVIDRLEDGGWITREPDESDRRKVRLRALHQRAPELGRLYAPMNSAITNLCRDLDDGQLTTIRDFLVAVSGAASQSGEEIHDRPAR